MEGAKVNDDRLQHFDRYLSQSALARAIASAICPGDHPA